MLGLLFLGWEISGGFFWGGRGGESLDRVGFGERRDLNMAQCPRVQPLEKTFSPFSLWSEDQ